MLAALAEDNKRKENREQRVKNNELGSEVNLSLSKGMMAFQTSKDL